MKRAYQGRRQRRQTGKMLAVYFAGVLTGLLVGLRLALIAMWRWGGDEFHHRVGLFNKRWTNRLAVTALRAGKRYSPYALIHHVGRRSGHAYATPVTAGRVADTFIIPLAYGDTVDWYRNMCAAGSCTIEWQGQAYRVGTPVVIDAAQALAAFPRLWRLPLRVFGIIHYIQVPITARTTAERIEAVPAQALLAAPEGRAARGQGQIALGTLIVLAVRRWIPMRAIGDARRATRGPAAVEARQAERLAELVAFAREHSPYYRRLYQDAPARITDIRQLPPVTKPELMAHFDEWVTDPAVTRSGVEAFVADLSKIGHPYLGRYLIYTTSGTTGEPALLVQDRRALVDYIGLTLARSRAFLTPHVLWALLSRGPRATVLYLMGGHYGAAVWQAWKHRSGFARSRDFDVLTPLPELVAKLNAYQPVVLSGYASVLVQLAVEQAAGRLRIHPALVATTAETLTPEGRQHITAAFGCAVREVYASSEAPVIAMECPSGRLHVNSDWFIVEPVDERYQPVPAGQPSHTVLVTNLANYVQPIIRYDQGDSITLDPEPCPCGSSLPVVHVQGRSGDLLTFAAPDGRAVQLLPLALGAVVEETAGVHRCQLIQTAPGTLTVRFEGQPSADPERVWDVVEQRLRAYLVAQGLTTVKIERSTEPPARDPRSGKFRQVWSESTPAKSAAPAASGAG